MGDVYTSVTLTGMNPSTVDESGRAYLVQVDEGGSVYRTSIYSDADCALLIAHTGTYSTTGAKAVTADNDSGVGGTVTVATAVATVDPVIAHFYRYSIVSAVTSGTLTIAGRDLRDGVTATVPYLWYGNPERVVAMPLNLPGSFATGSDTDALVDVAGFYGVWRNRRAQLACYRFTAATTHGSVEPRINVSVAGATVAGKNSGEGWELDTTPGTWVVANDLAPGQGIAEYGDAIEIVVTVQSGGSVDDKDLTLYAEWVLE